MNEITLLHLFKNGDHKAMKVAFDTNYEKAYKLAFAIVKDKQTAEDIALESFVKLFEHHASVDNIKSYLLTIIRNLSINYLSKTQREKKKFDIYAYHLEESSLNDSYEEDAELIKQIYKVAEHLPMKLKYAFQTIHIEGKTYAEMGRMLNKKPHAIQMRYLRALEWIKSHLKNKYHESSIDQSMA